MPSIRLRSGNKTDPAYASEIDALRAVASKTIVDFCKHPVPEGGAPRNPAPLDVAKRVMRSPRGEIRMSGNEMRLLAEAYLDALLSKAESAI